MKTIAIVGLSNNPDRPSFKVAKYFKDLGFKIIPVNPNINDFLGIKSYPNLKSISSKTKIDIVDIFRKSEEIVPIIKEIIETKRKPLVWLQEGIVNDEARKMATENGIEISMGLCLMKEHIKNAKIRS